MQRAAATGWIGRLTATLLAASIVQGVIMSDSYAEESATSGKATFAGGCFWCIEAVFQRVNGVTAVRSGYTGGHVDRPTYEQVVSGKSGHAEAVEVEFDPQQVSFEYLLDIFWIAHDPSLLNRQGADVGTQYRSAIFYHSAEQKKVAEDSKARQIKSGIEVVTQIAPAGEFFEAEAYHQNYYLKNSDTAYCTMVIVPKLRKVDRILNEHRAASTPVSAPK